MNAIYYAIGFLAGICDGMKWRRLRNGLYPFAKGGVGCDGFDKSSDWFLDRHLRKRHRA